MYEINYEFIGYIIPKSKTLDNLSQEKLDLMFSHINSYGRKSNQSKTPFELMQKRFGNNFLKAIGIEYIHPENVHLRPVLLK